MHPQNFFVRFRLALFATAWLAVATSGRAQIRQTLNFDPAWRFLQSDASGANAPGFNDSTWSTVDVPHDWSIAGPFAQTNPTSGGGGYLPSGISWYRKAFTLPAANSGSRVFIEFDGVMANSDVWINGHDLGVRPYGYVGFRYELTGYLNFGGGQTNVIAVKTDTSLQPASRWYTGQGLYRHVRLVICQPVHFAHWGVFVTTPTVAVNSGTGETEATVHVQATVENQATGSQAVTVKTVLLDPQGQPVASGLTSVQNVAAGGSAFFNQDLIVTNPALWDLASPQLYQAVSKVVAADGSTLDDETDRFGIRTIEFRSATGFWLNGRNVKILGVCLHHTGDAIGAAVPDRVWEHRLEQLKEIGVNAIRTSHNPPSPDFLALCDRLGFVVMLEMFDTWKATKTTYDYHLYFNQWWTSDTRDSIQAHRNHPSIIIYSAGNEIRDSPTSLPGTYLPIQTLIHQNDPTRPVTFAIYPHNETAIWATGIQNQMDVVGENYRPDDLVALWTANPASQYKLIDTEENHDRARWVSVRDNPPLAGCFVWTGFDYLGETIYANGSAGWPYVICAGSDNNSFGLRDIAGVLYPRGWQRMSWWSTSPMVHIVRSSGDNGTGSLVSDYTPGSGYTTAKVQVYSNCQQVELFLNGISLGVQSLPTDASALTWTFPYAPGTLLAVGRNGAATVATHALQTAGAPDHLVLTADRTDIAPTFDDLSHVSVNIVDASGVVCPTASNHLTFSLTGPGRIAALSTGDLTSHQPFQATERDAFNGFCLALIKATAASGPIQLTVSAPGLVSGSITLHPIALPAVTTPADVIIKAGQTALLATGATGDSLVYQWYRGESGDLSAPISGATTSSFTTPALLATASYWLRVGNSGGHADTGTIKVTVQPVPTFAQYLATLGLSGNNALPGAQPFADRLPNLLRYAMNLDASPSTGQLPVWTLSGSTGVAVQFRLRKGMVGVALHVQMSADLANWTDLPAGQLLQLSDDDPETGRYEAHLPVTMGSTMFLRLEGVQ
jgi:beta-galactosidase